MYFVSDGIHVLAFLLCLFLIDFEPVQEDEQPIQEPLLNALPKLFSLPFIVLIFGVFVTGLHWGVHAFLLLYLREDLNWLLTISSSISNCPFVQAI